MTLVDLTTAPAPVRASGHELDGTGIDEEDLLRLPREVNHRIGHLLTVIEVFVRQTHSPTVEGYRAKLTARISGLGDFYQLGCWDEEKIGMTQLLKQSFGSYCGLRQGQVLASGPELRLNRKLGLALHLVFHELAMNAIKYGALTSPAGSVMVEWELWPSGKLAIVWRERGGPEVEQPQRRGFGSHLITTALARYGQAQLAFHPKGVACYMLIDFDGTARAPQGV